MNGATSIWTPVLDKRLATRWSDIDRPSTSLIARELGLTKNQVIGRARRLCLPKRESPLPKGFVRKRPERAAHDYATGAPVAGLVGDCKFIAGEPHGMLARGENPFCGKPTLPGSPYCGAHHHICYQRATPQRLAEIDRVGAHATAGERGA